MMSTSSNIWFYVRAIPFWMLLVNVLPHSVFAQDKTSWPQVETLLTNFENAYVQSMQAQNDMGKRQAAEKVKKEIILCGTNGLPVIEKRLTDMRNPEFRIQLICMLREIPGKETDRLLIKILCNTHYDLRMSTVSQLVWRNARNKQLAFPLSDQELNVITSDIDNELINVAGPLVRFLGSCAQNGLEPRIKCILGRFIREINVPPESTPVFGAYTSPRVFKLLNFLDASKAMGAGAQVYIEPYLGDARKKENKEEEKWLTMALGLTGDPTVGDYLRELVLHESDPYVRCAGIPSFASSAGMESLPVLRQLANDKTPSEYSTCSGLPVYLIADAANAAIHKLECQKNEKVR